MNFIEFLNEKSFKEYIDEAVSGNYVSISVDKGIIIQSLNKKYSEFICYPKDQHVTLIYSETTNVYRNVIEGVLKSYSTIEAELGEVSAFDSQPKDGERDENLCSIVIKVKSHTLNEIHEKLKKIELKHSFPNFNPHISILYNFPQSEKEKAINLVNEYIKRQKKSITLSGFNIESTIKNWASK